MQGRVDAEGDEEGEEHVEALRETALEHVDVGDGVDDAAVLLLLQRRVVQVVVVAEEALRREGRKVQFSVVIMSTKL